MKHTFRPVSHWCIGPLRNQYGYVIQVAEIGETWILRWLSPSGDIGCKYFGNYENVIKAIHTLNASTEN